MKQTFFMNFILLLWILEAVSSIFSKSWDTTNWLNINLLQVHLQHHRPHVRGQSHQWSTRHHRPEVPRPSATSHLRDLRVSSVFQQENMWFSKKKIFHCLLKLRKYLISCKIFQFKWVWRAAGRVYSNLCSLSISSYSSRTSDTDWTGQYYTNNRNILLKCISRTTC